MNESERQDRLESRLSALEADVRRLRNVVVMLSGGRPPAGEASANARDELPSTAAPEPAAPEPVSREAAASDEAARFGLAASGAPQAERPGASAHRAGAAPARGRRDLEAWFGENGLLAVGALAAVLTVGFMLKYAFDEGWISPAVRVLAGLAVGLGVAITGERLQRRGLARYGAAGVGTGAAIAYLALWAAAGPYHFVSTGVGIVALAALSAFVLANAWRSGQPWLASMAALGAYLAPLLFGDITAFPNLLLAYVAAVSVTAGSAAAARRWPLTFWIVMAGAFLLGPLGSVPLEPTSATWKAAHPALFAFYVGGAGAAALFVTRMRGWKVHEAGAWLAGWWLLGVLGLNAADEHHAWAFLLAPALLVAPGWLETLRGRSGGGGPEPSPLRAPLVRRLRFGASAAMWAGIAAAALSPGSALGPLGVACLIALVYLLPGLRARVPDLLAAGLGILALGVATEWQGTAVILGWAALVVLGAKVTARSPLAGARWLVVALGTLAAYQLIGPELARRAVSDSAFTGHWPVAAASLLAALVLLAGPLWGESTDASHPVGASSSRPIDLRAASWFLAGAVLFAAGTSEIPRAFSEHFGSSARLAAGLSVSAFWLLYAGALLATGFRLNARSVRVGGLLVAGLAVLKVTIYDLGTLDALYRVASFALLALIALAGARAYHRRARGTTGGVSAREPME